MPDNTPIQANITEPALLLTINRYYRDDITPAELYQAVRGNWVVGEEREKAKYAFAVYQGIILQVYTIEGWNANSKRDDDQTNDNRWQFTGTIASDMRHYIGQSVAHYRKKGSANPVLYMNIKTKTAK